MNSQRENGSRITNKNVEKFSKKIIDLATSKERGMIQF
jgi:hypothetical protein